MAFAGCCLVFRRQVDPADDVFGCRDGAEDEGVEEAAEFVQGQRVSLAGEVSVFVGGSGDGQECKREHGQCRPAVPGTPAADLLFVHSGLTFAVWNDSSIFQRCPVTRTIAASGTKPDHRRQRDQARAVAAAVGRLAGGTVAAQQQPVVTGLLVLDAYRGPGAQPWALGPGAGRHLLPRPGRQRVGEQIGPHRCMWSEYPVITRDGQHKTHAPVDERCGAWSRCRRIAGHESGRHTGIKGRGDDPRG